jgi:hypothetical protein
MLLYVHYGVYINIQLIFSTALIVCDSSNSGSDSVDISVMYAFDKLLYTYSHQKYVSNISDNIYQVLSRIHEYLSDTRLCGYYGMSLVTENRLLKKCALWTCSYMSY